MNKIEANGNDITIFFKGKVNENSDFSDLLSEAEGQLIFDLEGISLLNSAGLRLWVLWMRTIKDGQVLVFRKCPRIVVDQMNILKGFIPKGAIIESFFVPYYCDECDFEDEYLAHKGEDFEQATNELPQGSPVDKERSCPKCGSTEMEMDIIPEKFFKFLQF